MLSLALPVDIYLCVAPTDMRKSFNGLWALTVEHLQRDPLAGGLFVFINRRRDLMKLLYWDTDGIAIWAKRLERGSFQIPHVDMDELNRIEDIVYILHVSRGEIVQDFHFLSKLNQLMDNIGADEPGPSCNEI